MLKLLGRLILRGVEEHGEDAAGDVEVPLTDEEAAELLKLIDYLLQSKEFLERSYFVEMISQRPPQSELPPRSIYFRMRAERGGSQLHAVSHWNQFCLRFGIKTKSSMADAVEPMDYRQFLRMEEKLAEHFGLDERVARLWMRFLAEVEPKVSRVRTNAGPGVSSRQIRGVFSDAAKSIRDNRRSYPQNGSLQNQNRLVGMFTLIADGAVMFTTRDWGVAGTISTMAGALILSLD